MTNEALQIPSFTDPNIWEGEESSQIAEDVGALGMDGAIHGLGLASIAPYTGLKLCKGLPGAFGQQGVQPAQLR